MADAQNRIFSINAAADALGKDRRTIDRALVGVAPDGHEGKSPRWRLASIVKALEARSGSAGSEDAAVIGELERLDQVLREGFERLAAEPDLAKRREMMKEIGPNIGALDRAFERANAARSDGERPLLEQHRDFVMRRSLEIFWHWAAGSSPHRLPVQRLEQLRRTVTIPRVAVASAPGRAVRAVTGIPSWRTVRPRARKVETALIDVHQLQQRAFDRAAPGREIQQAVEKFFDGSTAMPELPRAAVEHLRETARLASVIVGGEVRQCEQAAVQEFLVRLHIRVAASVDDDDDRDTILECAYRLLAQEFATTRH